jgi:hypothetical protein
MLPLARLPPQRGIPVIARRAALVLVVLSALVFAASASASTVSLKCGGKGPHNRDSAGTVLCAVAPGKARTIEGVVRDDANKPVSGPVTVTLSRWVPKGGYYSIEKFKTLTVNADAAGKFSYQARTATRISIAFEAAGAKGQADVSRQLAVTVRKLGGGKVRVTVRGGGKAPLTIYLVDDSGYEVSGTKGKRANKAGSAIFDLGNFHGRFSYVIEAGEYDDLFWEGREPTFHI